MSIDAKIKELLSRRDGQLNEEGMMPVKGKDTTIKAANPGDTTMPMQGGSQAADYETREEDEENQGAVTAKSTPNAPRPMNSGAGNAPNYTTTGDPTAVVNMKASSGNVAREGTEYDEDTLEERARWKESNPELKDKLDRQKWDPLQDRRRTGGRPVGPRAHNEYIKGAINRYKGTWGPKGTLPENIAQDSSDISQYDIPQSSLKEQLSAIFGDDLSEDFRDKATSIFEAAVIARVNDEMEKIAEQIEEQKTQELEEITEGLVEKVDSFMNYVVEQWMEENQLSVEKGLRTEIVEDFIGGLKTLFQEHYIEVPEEKFDIVEELQTKSDSLQEKLNDTVQKNIELAQELSTVKKEIVLGEMVQDLADTEAEKLYKLIEGVQYDNEDLFREKVKVIKENYFPKTAKSSPEEQILTEEAPLSNDDTISRYAQALSRSLKARK